MRAVHLTCHLVFHPKDKGKNSSDRHVKLFVNHLPRPRGVIDGAGKLWILEHGHAFFVRKFSNSERSEEHTSELQSLMRISYAVFCLKKKKESNHIIMLT